MAKEQLLRSLSTHERYSAARHNIGIPPVLLCFAQGKGDDEQVQALQKTLEQRTAHLLASAPMLSCYVHRLDTFHPQWAKQEEALAVEKVLLPIENVASQSDLEADALIPPMQAWSASNLRLTQPPLWRIRLLHHQPSSSFAVVLQIHHIIADGRAMLNIMQILLLDENAILPTKEQLQGTLAPTRQAGLPITNDEALNSTATILWKAMSIGKLAILPSLPLPSFVRDRLLPPKVWPHPQHVYAKANEAASKWFHVEIKNSDEKFQHTGQKLLSTLKQNAVPHGVQTINSVIHTACLVALYAFLRKRNIDTSSGFINTATAASERKAKEHGTISGNYVSAYYWGKRLTDEVNVWQVTREFGNGIVSPAGLDQRSKSFSLMPDFLGPLGERLHTVTADQPTPYESWFYAQARNPNAFSKAIALSNLGLLANVDEKIQRAAWTQVPRPFGEAFNVDACGWQTLDGQDALSICISVREGVLSKQGEEKVFVQAMRDTLLLFANGRVLEDTTFGTILEMLNQ